VLLEKVSMSMHTEILFVHCYKFFFVITCSFSVFVENYILLPKGINEFAVFLCIVHAWFWFFTLRLLIKLLTVYTCITFHFFALALGEKGVFYSDKKISMLHFCTWKKMHSETELLLKKKRPCIEYPAVRVTPFVS
jgi:hypothetical protein